MITRDDLRTFLGDRQWHSGVQLVDHFSGLIPPEQASQMFYSTRKNKSQISEIPLEAAVRKGCELVIANLLSSLLQAGLIETGGGKHLIEKKIRWTAWYCWLCGTNIKTSFEMSDSGLCSTCEDGIAKSKE